MNHSFPGAFPNQQVRLTFEKEAFLEPGYVLVYAFREDQLLFTHHRERGWELPGGTRRVDESPREAAIREVYEETGAELASLEPIGQYVITHPHEPLLIKTIYVAEIRALYSLPSGFETDNIQFFNPPPSADQVLANSEFSLLLKDGVYRYSLPVALLARAVGSGDSMLKGKSQLLQGEVVA